MTDSTRRAVLSGLTLPAVLSLSGCVFGIGGSGAEPLTVHNRTTATQTVTVTVVMQSDESTIKDGTVELEPAAEHQLDVLMRRNEQFTVTVDVTSGPRATFEWEDVSSHLHVILRGSDGILFTEQVGR